MKRIHHIIAFALSATAFAQGPLTPPQGADPNVGPINALNGSGAPQATMKTLHQVEPRIPIMAGSPGVTQLPGGGYSLSGNASYYLTGHLFITSGSGIVVGGSRVTVDLNGFDIFSGAVGVGGYGVEIVDGAEQVVVKNGIIKSGTTRDNNQPGNFTNHGFAAGVGSAGLPMLVTISGLTIMGCAGPGIDGFNGSSVDHCSVWGCSGGGIGGNTIADCAVYANGGFGLSAQNVSNSVAWYSNDIGIHGSNVVNCFSYNNGTGIYASTVIGSITAANRGHGIDGASVVKGCSSGGNLSGTGINALEGATIEGCSSNNNLVGVSAVNAAVSHCTAKGNTTTGFVVSGTLADCTATGGTQGFTAFGAALTNCKAAAASSDGFYVAQGTLSGCFASSNSGFGIYADSSSSISNCMASGNKRAGIYSDGGTVTGCTATQNGQDGVAANFDGAGIRAAGGMVTGCNATGNYQNGIYAPNGFVTSCRASGNSLSPGGWSGIYTAGGQATNNMP